MKPLIPGSGIRAIRHETNMNQTCNKPERKGENTMVKKNLKKIRNIAIISALVMSVLTGCGSSSNKSSTRNDYKNGLTYEQKMNADMAAGYYDGYGESYATEADYDDVDYYDEAYEESEYAAMTDDVSTDVNGGGNAGTEKKQTDNKLNLDKLIYRCNISVQTLAFESDVAEFKAAIKEYGAFIENENTYMSGGDYYYDRNTKLRTYTATIRVPSDKYEDFINKSGGIGELVNMSQNVENLSQEYSDLSVQLEVLAAERSSYVEMLKEAKSLSDMDNIILITDKITSIDIQVNQIKTRLNNIDNDVAYSYVDMSIREVKEYEKEPDESFGSRFVREVKTGWRNFLYGCQNFLIWFVAHLPGILLFLGIVFGIWKLILHIIKKIKAKRAAKRAEREKQMAARNASMRPMPIPAQGAQAAPATQGAPTAPIAPAAQVATQSAPAPAKTADTKTTDTKASDSKTTDTMATDTKTTDTKTDK